MAHSTTGSHEHRPVRVLILGGAYGGMAAALNLADLCAGKAPRFGLENVRDETIPVEITIVDERDGYYHLIGSPLALADEHYARKAWVKFEDIPALQHRQFSVRQGTVQSVDVEAKTSRILAQGSGHAEELSYDYLVAATGLRRAWPSVPQSLAREAYIEEVQPHIDSVATAEHGVAIIGGGAVGIEMAAELKLVCPDVKVTLIHSRDHLLSSEPLPENFKAQTLTLVRDAGIQTVMGKRVQRTSEESPGKKTLHLNDGSKMTVSEVINAVSGPRPTTSYLPQAVLNPDGEVKVNSDLSFASEIANAECHFGIGDLIPQTGVKRCGGAMHHGHYAAYNIHQHILFSRGLVEKAKYQKLADHGVNIGLAIGKKAIGYSGQTGIMAGEDTLTYLFGDDLGFKYCWDYLKLSEKTEDREAAVTDLPEPEKVIGLDQQDALAITAEA